MKTEVAQLKWRQGHRTKKARGSKAQFDPYVLLMKLASRVPYHVGVVMKLDARQGLRGRRPVSSVTDSRLALRELSAQDAFQSRERSAPLTSSKTLVSCSAKRPSSENGFAKTVEARARSRLVSRD